MIRKNLERFPAVFLIVLSIVLSGCSKSPETNVVVKTDNINQSTMTSGNTNISANNNISSASNTVSVNPPNAPMPVSENSLTAAVNNDKKSSSSVNDPKPQIGAGAKDFFLFTQVRSALSSDKELSNAVIVELKEGNAVLTGSVSSAAQKTKAGQMVQAVNGIKSVKNDLRVAS